MFLLFGYDGDLSGEHIKTIKIVAAAAIIPPLIVYRKVVYEIFFWL